MAKGNAVIGDYQELSTGKVGFIEAHGLWTSEQEDAAEWVLDQVRKGGLETVRVAFGDPHGLVRGKTLSVRAFESAMRNGVDWSPGPYFFDTGLDIVVNPFQAGGGFDVDEMTGAADFVVVPDPLTFRLLPWTDAPTGWVLGDEYFKSGAPVPFSSRQLLKRLLAELQSRQLKYVSGIEVEWYLTRVEDPGLNIGGLGSFGLPGSPPTVSAVNAGYQFNIEMFTDELDPILKTLREHLVALGLPLRTTEHESGPGQLEFTFEPISGLDGADAMLLFRNATKQVCARHGYHASFMCCPKLNGFDASGWHLHQSLFDSSTGENAFMSRDDAFQVSDLARHFVGGLLKHAGAACVFTTPTVNGYKRVSERFALSPDRVVWSNDNRGTFIRVLGEPHEPSTHLENRAGEPAANPYLYMASQIAAGLEGIDHSIDPGHLTDDPHSPQEAALPRSLREAVTALKADRSFRERIGSQLVEYTVVLKENELRRYEEDLEGSGLDKDTEEVTDWEQREYFRVY